MVNSKMLMKMKYCLIQCNNYNIRDSEHENDHNTKCISVVKCKQNQIIALHKLTELGAPSTIFALFTGSVSFKGTVSVNHVAYTINQLGNLKKLDWTK